jgi:predicted nucleotidyltransferase
MLTIVIKMLTLLRTGYGKIMQLFYKDKSVKLHLREIARQTKLFEPSAYRFLNSLEKDQILSSEKEGNLKKFSVKSGIRAYFLFEAFDLDKFEKLSSIRKNAIKIYLNNLSEKPIFAILFGSTAKRTYKNDSDIDILLITNEKINVKQAENETNALTAMNMSTFQITYEDFITDLKMKEDKVVQSAIYSGYPLINHIQYYEVLYNERI